MNDQEIEQEIQAKGLTAPRVTPSDIEANIIGEHYFTAAQALHIGGNRPNPLDMLTFCVLVLQNGFTVTGESACASPANFDADIGRKVARENAVNKVWPLMGYALKQKLYDQADIVEVSRRMNRIARVAHEVNRAYCEALGDHSQPAWEDAPMAQRVSARMGVDLHSMSDFGPEASHISWMNQKLEDGWVYGPVKDPVTKQHPCIVPFSELPREQQAKDYLFRGVVRALRD